MQVDRILDKKLLDVSALVVAPQLILHSDKASPLSSIDFGALLYDSRSAIRVKLTNASLLPVSFQLKFRDPDLGSLDEELLEMEEERPFSVSPSEGTLQPKETTALKIVFRPRIPTVSKGFSTKFINDKLEPKAITVLLMIESSDMSPGSKFISAMAPVRLFGSAVLPRFSFSPMVLQFGQCAVNDHVDILATLVSQTDLDVSFLFSSIPFYKFRPPSGRLRARQSLPIVVSFSPSQLGKFHRKVKLSIGPRTIEIKVKGRSDSIGSPSSLVGGTEKLPEDFTAKLKFVDPVKASNVSFKFRRELPWNRSEFLTSLSWNEEAYREHDKLFTHDANGPLTFSRQTLQRREEHRQKYNQYLEQSRKSRQVSAVVVDEKGLQEPKLSLPPAPEKLWMLFEGNESRKRDSSLNDENKLILKKYPFSPQTQSEMKDCSAELPLEDFKQIVASHKILNFGKVSITSMAAKNFSVINNLSRPVLVRISDIDKDMKESTPISQVIPGHGIAGFDVSPNEHSENIMIYCRCSGMLQR